MTRERPIEAGNERGAVGVDARGVLAPCPATPEELHAFLRVHAGLRIARTPLCPGSAAPFDYLVHAFFEGRVWHQGRWRAGPADCVLWANRGGGKTFLGAVATALDLAFKPGVQVRILAGSAEQGSHMFGHLRRLFARRPFDALLDGRPTRRRLAVRSGGVVEVLAASQASVRGTRPQKLRADELDLFDAELWRAAQLTTRSLEMPGPWGRTVRGSIDALSTMHRPMGLMHRVAGESHGPEHWRGPDPAGPRGRLLLRWNIIDCLEHCPPGRACDGCGLWDACAGRAKSRPPEDAGHVAIDDALTLRSRCGVEAWEAEMLCLRPARREAVYPEFDEAAHVIDSDAPPQGRWLAGLDFGFRGPTAVLWAHQDDDGTLRVMHERIVAGRTVAQHAAAIASGRDPDAPDAPDAPPTPRPAWVAIDPAGRQVNDQTGVSSALVLRRAGLAVRSMPMRVHPGVMLVRARLAPADGSGPRLFVHRRCAGLIAALRSYRYPADRPESLEPLKDGADHPCDALRYLVAGLDRPAATRRGRYR